MPRYNQEDFKEKPWRKNIDIININSSLDKERKSWKANTEVKRMDVIIKNGGEGDVSLVNNFNSKHRK